MVSWVLWPAHSSSWNALTRYFITTILSLGTRANFGDAKTYYLLSERQDFSIRLYTSIRVKDRKKDDADKKKHTKLACLNFSWLLYNKWKILMQPKLASKLRRWFFISRKKKCVINGAYCSESGILAISPSTHTHTQHSLWKWLYISFCHFIKIN